MRFHWFYWPVLIGVLFIVVGCGGGSSSSGGFGAIDGYILTPIGSNEIVPSANLRSGHNPLPGATVTVRSSSKITDNDGYYEISGLPAGYQTVEVSKAGYATARFAVEVLANRVTRVPSAEHARWTILVYINGDNDLESAAIHNMNQMEQVGSTKDVRVVVQVDRHPGHDSSNGDWTDTRRYLITRDQDPDLIHSTLLQETGELDMGSPQTLKDFVEWGMTAYPADHTMLILWDHGRGWRSARTQERKLRAISYDYTSGTNLSLEKLTAALSVEKKLDIVAFDACLMGLAEVAYALKDAADMMVASEENVPFNGQPYHKFLAPLVANPAMTPEQLGRTMAQVYVAHYGPGSLTTESVLDLGKIASLASRIKIFGEDLRAIRVSHGDILEDIRTATQHYDNGAEFYADYKDLYDYARRVALASVPAGVQTASRQVMESVLETVLYQVNSGRDVGNSHGLAIYLPGQPGYLNEYGSLQFARDTRWDLFLAP